MNVFLCMAVSGRLCCVPSLVCKSFNLVWIECMYVSIHTRVRARARGWEREEQRIIKPEPQSNKKPGIQFSKKKKKPTDNSWTQQQQQSNTHLRYHSPLPSLFLLRSFTHPSFTLPLFALAFFHQRLKRSIYTPRPSYSFLFSFFLFLFFILIFLPFDLSKQLDTDHTLSHTHTHT